MPGSRRVNPEHQPSPAHLGRQYAHERKIYDPRSWKGRAVAYIQRLKNRFAGRNARDVLTQATAKHAAASKLSDRGVENLSPRQQRRMMALERAYERDVQHLTAPDRAMQVLAKQKARGDQSTLVPEQPTPELDQYQNRAEVRTDIGMKSVQTLGEGAFGKVESVKPGLAGPISVKKQL